MQLRKQLLIDIRGGFAQIERLHDASETVSQIIARLTDEIQRLTLDNRALRRGMSALRRKTGRGK